MHIKKVYSYDVKLFILVQNCKQFVVGLGRES